MEWLLTYGIKISITIVICSILITITRAIFSKIFLKNKNLQLKFLQSAITVVITVVGVYSCLYQFDATRDISKTLMQGGTLLIAIVSFAAQHVLANTISGVAISLNKPFEVGDKIKLLSISGALITEGYVMDINLRHTVIKKFDGQCDIVPNSIMDSSIISNINFIENVGNMLEVNVSYNSDIDLACNLLKNIVILHPLTINKDNADTTVTVKELGLNGVTLKVLIKTETLDDSFTACSEIRKEILKQFKINKIAIPYQTVTVVSE